MQELFPEGNPKRWDVVNFLGGKHNFFTLGAV